MKQNQDAGKSVQNVKAMGDPSFGKCNIRIMSNDILQVNGVYLQRRKKFLATINTLSNARKRYKKKKKNF